MRFLLYRRFVFQYTRPMRRMTQTIRYRRIISCDIVTRRSEEETEGNAFM